MQRSTHGADDLKGGPKGKELKSDVTVAKNYLAEDHIKELNRIVSAYLDLAENRAERQIAMDMADWVRFLDNFLGSRATRYSTTKARSPHSRRS